MNINKATITFIYSFLPVVGEMTYDQRVQKMFSDSKLANTGNKGLKPSRSGEIVNRMGLSSYLSLNIEMGYDIDYEFKGYLKNDPSLRLTIQPLFRFFTFGCSLTFHVTCYRKDAQITHEDVYKVLQIISTEGNRRANQSFVLENLADNNKHSEFTLYEFFEFRRSEKINKIIKERKGKALNIKLLGLSKKVLVEKEDEEINIPWVITTIETQDKEVLDAFCYSSIGVSRSKATDEKLNKIARYEHLIAPLLFRAVDKEFDSYKIEPSYDSFSLEARSNGLYNMYIDARFYFHMSRRSMISIFKDSKQRPASYLLPTLYDLCELIHTRWHSLIILNMILDKSIHEFSNPRLSSEKKLNTVLNLLKKSLYNLENPTDYVISGDSLREFLELLISTYKIKELQASTISKVNLLEKIYILGLQIEVAKRYK